MRSMYHFVVRFWGLQYRIVIRLPYPDLCYNFWGICDFLQAETVSRIFIFSAVPEMAPSYSRQFINAWEIEFNFKEKPTFPFLYTYAHTTPSHPL